METFRVNVEISPNQFSRTAPSDLLQCFNYVILAEKLTLIATLILHYQNEYDF